MIYCFYIYIYVHVNEIFNGTSFFLKLVKRPELNVLVSTIKKILNLNLRLSFNVLNFFILYFQIILIYKMEYSIN